ncbi:hypothetical protein IVB12_15870 [Bradyrhizobium sp. 179]|uniref:hypothetical protein n=1 Tax=Bradyrhizobium sp. 179 TaxID=2782648 RepID=UPI001FFB8BAA|nr:hypothetical protein [Bradyrhizobium sp. 179]MCK1543394.1 hypothetical protein [Bradyrhizobium sp. 179]
MTIEVYTGRYEREHLRKPMGRRFWRFTLVSPTITVKDHSLVLQDAMTYQKALQKAQEVAELRRSVRIIVEP